MIYSSDTSFHKYKNFYKMSHFPFQPLNHFKKMDESKIINYYINLHKYNQ